MFKRLLPVLLMSCVSLLFAAPAMAELTLERFAIGAQNQNGTPDVQAGSHPYALTNTFVLSNPGPASGDLKDLTLQLPPGFVGNPDATPRCSYQEFVKASQSKSGCSSETAVGISTTYFVQEEGAGVQFANNPVYNLVPPRGVAAEFGFIVAGNTPVFLDTGVRTGGDYGLTTNVREISQALLVAASKVTIWGVPASPEHNQLRGRTCVKEAASEVGIGGNSLKELVELAGGGLRGGEDEIEGPSGPIDSGALIESTGAECPTQAPQVPLLTNPTSCNTPRTATMSIDSWQEPGNFATGEHVSSKTASMPEITGCEKLDFSPTIGVEPDGKAGSTPTGLNVGVHVPQEPTENPEGLAEANVRDATVTLPPGMQLSPSASDGLQACSTAQVGFTGFKELDPTAEAGVQTAQFKAKVYDPETGQEEATLCPDASKVGNVKVKTPLLEGELEGSVYLASPQNFTFAGAAEENPFKSLVAMYLVAEEPRAGVIVKVPGSVSLDPNTGQITTTFDNQPQLPYSDVKFEFYGTDRAPLATPARCGTYTTEASLTPWTATAGSATPPVNTSAGFEINTGPVLQSASGPHTSACPGTSLPFAPTLQSGTTNNNAGSFSNLTTTFSREDGQQSLSSITLHYPPGVSGILTGVPLCGEAEANVGTCSEASKIGETIVSVGLGNDPFSVTGGKVYLTGPYDGAPFGLSIVNPAKAGPFDLQEGRPVIVRAKIEVNPATAALTITTTNDGAGGIPSIIDGIPLQIKHVNVNITRTGFTFNPTSCNPMKVESTIGSFEGGSVQVSDPFQVASCASLKFTPKFSVSTSGKTSRAKGASLTTKVEEPAGSMGTQANLAYVKVELPGHLPSRLTTLQKACTQKQFEANPAGCPSESKIGYAVVHTPLVPVPLTGPAIFVSHGDEAFPSLTMVLQGYGVTIDLAGATDIKHGVTSTTFKTVPDQPFSSFELTLPEGPYSALAANGNLCHETKTVTVKKKETKRVHGKLKRVTIKTHKTVAEGLVMPNELVGQNGAVVKEDTAISVTGCAKVKPAKKAKAKAKAKHRAKKGRR